MEKLPFVNYNIFCAKKKWDSKNIPLLLQIKRYGVKFLYK